MGDVHFYTSNHLGVLLYATVQVQESLALVFAVDISQPSME